ncbi:e3 ubiquitin-protein ligase RAD18 [Caerostris extrusa]|uniref:RING-type E3 ubiquitin transferase n=1 Tax=Caerostris extrusa TaxID=172846 RepID=A0AAV4Q1Z9_CAEEX|nr:e3 ubiquitin-protein ligase RAD18 [Caerostris extrusa]
MASKSEDVISNLSEENIGDFETLGLNTKTLKPLDEALRCSICYDYFNNCMMTKCSHNYCSLCIRKYMMYKTQCPTCFMDTSEPELRNNRLIDEVVRLYKKVRVSVQSSHKPQPKLQTEHYPIVKTANIRIKSEPCTPSSSQHEDIYLVQFATNQKSLPKLVYHLLSDKDIRKRLKEHGLNTSGHRKALIHRHKSFVTLYNSNFDSLDPKTVPELVLEIEHQELEERVNYVPTKPVLLPRNDISEIEKEHQDYAKQHQSQFNCLLHDIQQRHLNQTVVKQEIMDDSNAGDCDSENETIRDCNIQKEKHKKLGDSISSSENDKTTYKSPLRKEKEASDENLTLPKESINPETLSHKIKKEFPLSESSEKIQDTCSNDSSLGVVENDKMTQVSLLRKRKKGRLSTENQTSPKKK